MPGGIGKKGQGRRAADPPARPRGTGFGYGIGADEQCLDARTFGSKIQAAGGGQVESGRTSPCLDKYNTDSAAAQAIYRSLE